MKRGFGLGISLAAILILLLTINVIGAMSLGGRQADFTEDHLYTLDSGTKQLLGRLNDKVSMKVFYSKSAMAEIPVLKQFAERTIQLLHQFENAGGGKIALETLEPRPDTETEELAIKYGLRPVSGYAPEDIYFGLVLVNEVGKEESIPFITPDRENTLEYDVARLISSLETTTRKRIGVMTPLPMMGNADDPAAQYSGQPPQQAWVFVQELKKQYDVSSVAMDSETIDKTLDLLLVVHPKAITDKAQYAIDQYLIGGGHVVALVDPLSFDELSKFQDPNPQARMQTSFSSDLPKLLKAWGVEYDPKKVALDPALAVSVNLGQGRAGKHPAFIRMADEQCNKDDMVSANVDSLMFGAAGVLNVDEDAAKKNGLKYTWLVRTTDSAGEGDAMTLQFGGDPDALARDMTTTGKPENVALKITGKFKTAFPDGPPKAAPAEGDKAKPEPVGPQNTLKEAKADNSVVVFADVDMIADDFCVQKQPFFGGQMLIQMINSNIATVSNAVEQLMGAPELIGLRMRGKNNRPFTVVQDLERAADKKWKDNLEKLNKEVEDTQRELDQMQSGKSDANQAVLSADQETKIQQFREKLAASKKEQRQVKLNLREDIEALGTKIKLINMALVPLLVLIAGFIPVVWRNRRLRRA